jgi:hypothetical protein
LAPAPLQIWSPSWLSPSQLRTIHQSYTSC